jgi:hypothetical protein
VHLYELGLYQPTRCYNDSLLYFGYYIINLLYTLWCLITQSVSSVYTHHQEYYLKDYWCLIIWFTVYIIYGGGTRSRLNVGCLLLLRCPCFRHTEESVTLAHAIWITQRYYSTVNNTLEGRNPRPTN